MKKKIGKKTYQYQEWNEIKDYHERICRGQKIREYYNVKNLNTKKSFSRLEDPKKECRLWQEHLTALQMYETTFLEEVEENVLT